MIGRLSGVLLERNPPQVLIDVHGLGYEVDVPMSTFYNLPANGEKVTLLTHFIVREDGQFLYGFASEAERFAFRQLIKISGIGARMALAVLSGLSVGDLAQAIARPDAATASATLASINAYASSKADSHGCRRSWRGKRTRYKAACS